MTDTTPKRKGRARQARWDRLRMRTVSTRLPEPVAAAFYALCAASSITRYEALARYIEACIEAGSVIDAGRKKKHATKKKASKQQPA